MNSTERMSYQNLCSHVTECSGAKPGGVYLDHAHELSTWQIERPISVMFGRVTRYAPTIQRLNEGGKIKGHPIGLYHQPSGDRGYHINIIHPKQS